MRGCEDARQDAASRGEMPRRRKQLAASKLLRRWPEGGLHSLPGLAGTFPSPLPAWAGSSKAQQTLGPSERAEAVEHEQGAQEAEELAGTSPSPLSGVGRTGFSGTWFSDVYWGAPPRPVPLAGTAVTRKTPVTANLVQ
eukprot:598978-Pyramimonas_sp.AAC.1